MSGKKEQESHGKQKSGQERVTVKISHFESYFKVLNHRFSCIYSFALTEFLKLNINQAHREGLCIYISVVSNLARFFAVGLNYTTL